MTTQKEITRLIETYRTGWADLDAEVLGSIWDPNYETIYCPIELAAPLRGHAALSAYFTNVVQLIQAVHSMEVSSIWIDDLGDIAYAFFDFRFVGDMPGKTEPHIVNGRNTIICHRIAEKWKGIHYHESLQGPPQPRSQQQPDHF
jgi:ketosteroid isomerase-like protein